MPKTNVYFDGRKEALVDIAGEVFFEKGYERATVSDLMEAMSLSKGGFYHYFSSKEEILLECIYRISNELKDIAQTVTMDDSLAVMDKLKRFFSLRQLLLEDKKQLIKMMNMIYQVDKMKYAMIETIELMFIDAFSNLIEQGNLEGVFDVEFPRETAILLLSLIVPRHLSKLVASNTIDVDSDEEIDKAVNQLILRTLGIKETPRSKEVILNV